MYRSKYMYQYLCSVGAAIATHFGLTDLPDMHALIATQDRLTDHQNAYVQALQARVSRIHDQS